MIMVMMTVMMLIMIPTASLEDHRTGTNLLKNGDGLTVAQALQ